MNAHTDNIGYEADGAPDDKLYDKVAKLLAKAEGTTNQAEAETFFAKAQELITKHMLDEMVLKAKVNGGTGKDEPIDHEVINFSVTFQKADSHMWHCVAMANHCQVLSRGKEWPKPQRGIVLIGRKSDRDRVKMLTTSLLLQVARLERPEVPSGLSPSEKNMWRRSFRFGFADAVGKRLKSAHDEAAKTHTKGDMLPVLASLDQRVGSYAQETFNPKVGRAVRINGAGESAGRRAGQRADVGSTKVSGSRGSLGRGR